MKKCKKVIVFALMFALLATSGLGSLEVQAAKKTGSINGWNIYVNKGKSVMIPHTGKVSFKSGSAETATVSKKGVIKGKKSDNLYVKAKYYYNKTDSKQYESDVNVYVIDSKKQVKSISVKKKSINMSVGDKQKVVYSVNPKKHTDEIMLFSSDRNVVDTQDSSGNLVAKAIAPGKAKLSIVSSSGKVKQINITVKKNKKSYCTQFGVQVPFLKKSVKKGTLEFLEYNLNDWGSDSISGNVKIKNNGNKAIDNETKIPVTFYDAKKKEIKPEWNGQYNIRIEDYTPAKAKIQKEYGSYNAYFNVPKGAKSFTVGTPLVQDVNENVTLLKASKAVKSIKVPNFPQEITAMDGHTKVLLEKITNESDGSYAYIKNNGTQAATTPTINTIHYNAKGEIAYWSNIGQVHLEPGETYKDKILWNNSGVKKVDFVVDVSGFRAATSTVIKGNANINGITVPQIGTTFEASRMKASVTNYSIDKDIRSGNTSWMYRTNINLSIKIIEKLAESNNYFNVGMKFYAGGYVVNGYNSIYINGVEMNKEYSSEQYLYSKFHKQEKVAAQIDRIDFYER